MEPMNFMNPQAFISTLAVLRFIKFIDNNSVLHVYDYFIDQEHRSVSTQLFNWILLNQVNHKCTWYNYYIPLPCVVMCGWALSSSSFCYQSHHYIYQRNHLSRQYLDLNQNIPWCKKVATKNQKRPGWKRCAIKLGCQGLLLLIKLKLFW